MKIAISMNNGYISDHFGRCAAFMIYDIDGGRIKSKEEIPNPGHKPGYLPRFLSEMNIQCIISGGMGQKAQELFDRFGIESITGVKGTVDEIIRKYQNDELETGKDRCNHGGQC